MAADAHGMGFAVGDIWVRIFPDSADLNLNIAGKAVGDCFSCRDRLIGCDHCSRTKSVDRAVNAGDLHRPVQFGFGIGRIPGNDVRAGRLIALIVAGDANLPCRCWRDNQIEKKYRDDSVDPLAILLIQHFIL